MRILFLGFVSVTLSAFLFLGYLYWTFVFQPASSQKKDFVFEVTLQESFMTVARKLEHEGLVKNAQMFNVYARLVGQRSRIRAGEYALNSNMRPKEILSVLVSGISIAKPLTIPEGYNVFEIAELIEKAGVAKKKDFIKLVFDPDFVEAMTGEKLPSLEGYLYPETYQITKYMNVKDIIAAQVKQFRTVFESIVTQKKIDNLTPRQILILASIIEKETGKASDRTLVSSVFHNRLNKKMKLQTDPTIIYGKTLFSGKIETNITKQDLLSTTNPYNTYTIPSLPPGPISNPGKSSLMAAVQPAQTNYLFFVSQNDGTTRFTTNLAEHSKNVQETQIDPRAREGKSWRDLNKKNK